MIPEQVQLKVRELSRVNLLHQPKWRLVVKKFIEDNIKRIESQRRKNPSQRSSQSQSHPQAPGNEHHWRTWKGLQVIVSIC